MFHAKLKRKISWSRFYCLMMPKSMKHVSNISATFSPFSAFKRFLSTIESALVESAFDIFVFLKRLLASFPCSTPNFSFHIQS